MITLLDAQASVDGGVLTWRLLVDVDDARLQYVVPGFTFEARAAEYGITDPEELLDMVLLELRDAGEEQVDPYGLDEATARARKRAVISRIRGRHPVRYAHHEQLGDMRAYMLANMRLNPDNIEALRERVDRIRQRRQAAKSSEPRAQAFSSPTFNPATFVDTQGPVAEAREALERRRRAQAARALGGKTTTVRVGD